MTKNDIQPAMCRNVLTLCSGYGCAFGDNYAYSCMLEAGHGGPHYDEFTHGEQTVVIVWHTKPFTVSISDKEE